LSEPRTGAELTQTSTLVEDEVEENMAIATGRVAQVSVEIGGREISFETGKLAKQADGAVLVRAGETMVLATAQGRTEAREGADFFPLTVDVEERMYAAGKIPGGFFKREGRPTERAILTARMIDRPIRPLWPKGFKNEVQVICTVLSADMVVGHDILCINGASAALMISPLPFLGPVGAVRIGRIDGELVVNPTLQEANDNNDLDLIVVGTKDALTMVEAGADEVPEELLLEALDLAHNEIRKLCEAQEQLRERSGKSKWLDPSLTEELQGSHATQIRERIASEGLREAGSVIEELVDELAPPLSMESTDEDITRQLQVRSSLATIIEQERLAAIEAPVRQQFENDLRALTEAEQDSKELKSAKRHLLFERIVETVELPFPVGPAPADGETPVKDTITKQYVKRAAEAIYKDLVRKKIAVEKRRPDGRGAEEIRPIEVEVGVNPRAHGSGLFTRGQTQILTSLTLGTAKEGQRIDDLSLEEERRYMHHYNFPPYSVGETGFMRGPKRRDIGHGALAQRALEAMIPPASEFPYTIRLVSETLESNGSSSMGSVCGSTLALMDAGVPIKAPVSGIAMGLVKEGDDYVILTDIQGAEDHLGDMDFKVAGTRDGVTALQMDIKITGVTREIMQNALEQAKQARNFILDKMLEAIPETRTELAAHAPRITSIKINPEFIGLVIGKGGETIRGLESDYDVQVDIEEDGTILIYATEGTKAEAAIAAIEGLTKSPEVGDEYHNAKVVKTTQFGAFVELKKGTDGLLHVSNVGPGRVGHIEDVINRGDILDVLVQEVDKERGRIGLKLIAKHENGAVVTPEELIERAKNAPPREEREERPRGDRRGGRGGGRDRGPRRD
jgi:polyribonucleotide nucleotidyltransferase